MHKTKDKSKKRAKNSVLEAGRCKKIYIYSRGLRWKLGRGIVWAIEDVQLNLILALQDH